MKFEPGKTYKTRSGDDALIYCVDAPGDEPIHGRIGQHIMAWPASGEWAVGPEYKLDLVPHADGLVMIKFTPETIARAWEAYQRTDMHWREASPTREDWLAAAAVFEAAANAQAARCQTALPPPKINQPD
jgi:hypothetical protein